MRWYVLCALFLMTACAGPGDTSGQTAGTVDGGGAPDIWFVNAVDHRDQVGKQFTYSCTSNGAPDSIWGTDVYTDDSSVCTAAVHAGRITMERGGQVTIQMSPGLESYTASTRHGVASMEYSAWLGSFFFP